MVIEKQSESLLVPYKSKDSWFVQYKAKEWLARINKHHDYGYHQRIIVIADDVISAVRRAEEYSLSREEVDFKPYTVSKRQTILVPEFGSGVGEGFRVKYSGQKPGVTGRTNGEVRIVVDCVKSTPNTPLLTALELGNRFAISDGLEDVRISDVSELGKHYY